jgi:hypothetical protein
MFAVTYAASLLSLMFAVTDAAVRRRLLCTPSCLLLLMQLLAVTWQLFAVTDKAVSCVALSCRKLSPGTKLFTCYRPSRMLSPTMKLLRATEYVKIITYRLSAKYVLLAYTQLCYRCRSTLYKCKYIDRYTTT